MDIRYLRGLNLQKLLREDNYLIPAIDALAYCDRYPNKTYIRSYQLQKQCDNTLLAIGKRLFVNRAYDLHLKRCEKEKLIRIEKISHSDNKKETRIYPIKEAIGKIIEAKKNEHPAYGGKKIVDWPIGEPIPRKAAVFEPSIRYTVSEYIARQTSKVRATPTESLKVSGTVSAVVTHANQRKKKKKKKVPKNLIERSQSIKK